MKKIHRFLTDFIPDGDQFTLSDDRVVHQINRVLKIHPGEEIALFTNGSDDTLAVIESVEKKSLRLRKIGVREKLSPFPTSLTAVIGIPKGDMFELVVQKLTELGVREIVPLRSVRTVKENIRLERLQAISDEALEQCGGSTRVIIHSPMTLAQCIETFPGTPIVFDTESSSTEHTGEITPMVMYIGPEGGWGDEERTIFGSHGALFKSLGTRTLRTETAAIVGAYTLLWK